MFDYEKIAEEFYKIPGSRIYIGCDSFVRRVFPEQKGTHPTKKRGNACFAVAVALHMGCNRGCKVWTGYEVADFYGLRQRLMAEVHLATGVFVSLADYVPGEYIDVHLDLNPSKMHRSNLVLQEAIGYFFANAGKDPIVKPDAFCASIAADHYARIGG